MRCGSAHGKGICSLACLCRGGRAALHPSKATTDGTILISAAACSNERCNTSTSSIFVPLQGLQHHGQQGPCQHEANQSLEQQAMGVRQVALREKST